MTTTASAEIQTLIANIERVIVGKREVVELLAIAMLCEGHVLLEDVPGTGKTTLAKAMARSTDGSYRRIQFTPDLLPSDVTGSSIYNQRTSDFEFRAGPIDANIVLADEINRATPRTQSALLEAMEERRVTVEGTTYDLPRPFMVLATQNPIELEGTFPLPEAQLDRFLFRVEIGYPNQEDEEQIILSHAGAHPLDVLDTVIASERIVALGDDCAAIHVAPDVLHYIVRLVRATRDHSAVELGASPRASIGLYRAAQARAFVRGQSFVTPDDVQFLAHAVLEHRLSPSADARLRGRTAREILDSTIESVAVPLEIV